MFIRMFIKHRFGSENGFVHKDFITTFLLLKLLKILLTFRGNVYKNVHKNCVINICMNKMLAVKKYGLSEKKRKREDEDSEDNNDSEDE